MVQVPANAAKAFDELQALLGGAGARIPGALSAGAAQYEPGIVANLSKVGVKVSPDFLGDFLNTTGNSRPAATAPESAQALQFSPGASWGMLLTVGAIIVLGGYFYGRR